MYFEDEMICVSQFLYLYICNWQAKLGQAMTWEGVKFKSTPHHNSNPRPVGLKPEIARLLFSCIHRIKYVQPHRVKDTKYISVVTE